MENKDILVLESINEDCPVRCCAIVPNFAAKVGDLAKTAGSGLCKVVYRFYDPCTELIAALTDAYGADSVEAIFRKEWEADSDA